MSEPNSPDTEPRAAVRQLAEAANAEKEKPVEEPYEAWFKPGPKTLSDSSATYLDHDARADDAPAGQPEWAGAGNGMFPGLNGDAPHRADEWFLRTGRAGLLPDSMVENWGVDDTHVIPVVVDATGAPPWAGDKRDQDVEEPPPWESGPWPGPGEERPDPRPRSAAGSSRAHRQMTDDTLNWQGIAAAVTGILPLVLPGAVLGFLGLRRAQSTGTGRTASWLGIGLSGIWALVLIVLLVTSGGGSGAACTPASETKLANAMSATLRDLSSSQPQSTVVADLNNAVSQANAAQVSAQQIAARNALATLTSGLQQSLTAISANHSTATYSAVHAQLLADTAAVTTACKA